MYAHIADGQVTQTRHQPPSVWQDSEGVWWDLRPGQHDPRDAGWVEVVETTRPDDTDTHTHDSTVELVDSVPTRAWTPRPWTADEIAWRAETDARLDDAEDRLARIEAKLWPPADPDAEPPADVPTMADYGGVWPAGQLLSDGGKVWRNATTVPLTTAPSDFPGEPSQWTRLFVEHGAVEPEPEPEPGILAWAVGQTVTADDKRTHAGRLWSAKIAHTTHVGWEPSAAAHAVWTDLGPA